MAVNLGSVFAELTLKTDQWKKGIQNVQKDVKGMSSSVTSAMESAKKGSYAFAGALTAIGVASVNFGLIGGKYSSVRDAFGSMTKDMEVDVDSFQRKVADASGNQIDNFKILSNATKALSLIGKDAFGNFGDDFEKMAMLSKKAARATGQDVDYMFDSLVTGIARESKLILDNLGITIDIEDAKAKYAESLGKSSDQLTISEEKTAVLNETMRHLENTYGAVAISSGGFSGEWQKLTTTLQNARIEIGQALEPALTSIAKAIQPLITSALPLLVDFINNLSETLPILAGAILGGLTPALYAAATGAWALIAPLLPFIAIGTAIGLAIKLIIDALGGWEVVSNRVKEAFIIFRDTLATGWDLIKQKFEELKPSLTELWNSFILLKEAISPLIEALKPLAEAILPAVISMIEAFAIILGTLLVVSTTVWAGVMAGIGAALPHIISVVTSMITTFTGLINFLVGVFTLDWKKAMTGIEQMSEGAKEFIINAFEAVQKFLETFKNTVIEIFTAIYNALVGHSIIPDLVNESISLFTNMVTSITNILNPLVNICKTIFQNAWNAISSELSTWPGRVKSWGERIARSFVDGFSKLGDWLKEKARAALDAVKGILEGHSPPKEGPFKNIDKWGANIGMAWVEGLQGAIATLTMPSPAFANPGVSSGSFSAVKPQTITHNNSPQFTVNIGTYAGSPMEKRALAKELHDAYENYQLGRGEI
jgi:phage-related protein